MLVAVKNTRLDLLNRQEFVDQMLTIAKALSEKKKNACYAVDGSWGVGKSFVLDMFEEQAKDEGQEGEVLSRFLIFRYNCWEYDYYEEPLVAIVASILDQIDEKVDLLPADTKTRVKAALKAIGKGFLKMGAQAIKENTGFDAEAVFETAKDGVTNSKDDIEDAHAYDLYFGFKKTLKKLRTEIESLSKDQTVLFVVDELDRCLPEYTIRVLERLHHLFDGVDNIQVILSVDEGQLEHTVKQIYGDGTNAKSYLRKFIRFELKLSEGVVKENFNERFKNYTSRFEIKDRTTSAIDVEEYKSYILNGLDMRQRISIIERCELIHSFLCDNDSKQDSSYMCLEMLLVILKDCEIDTEHAKKTFSKTEVFEASHLNSSGNQPPAGLLELSGYYKSKNKSKDEDRHMINTYSKSTMMGSSTPVTYVEAGTLIGKLLCAYRTILGFEKDQFRNALDQDEMKTFLAYAKDFWNYLLIVC